MGCAYVVLVIRQGESVFESGVVGSWHPRGSNQENIAGL